MTGALRHRIDIQTIDADDGFGDGKPTTATLLRTEMFSLEPLSGQELIVAEQTQSQVTHTARCHYFEGATSALQLKHKDRTFNVSSVVNEREMNMMLVWKLIEVTG